MFTYTTRKDGRLMKRVSVDGKLKTIYSDNPKDLENQYIELKYLSNKGIVADSKNMTVSDWSDKWLELYKSDKSQATIDMYKTTIRLHIKPHIGHLKLNAVKQADIVNILNELSKKGITRRKEWALLTIQQILRKAVENELIYKNVAEGVEIQKYKSPEKKPLPNSVIERIKKLSLGNHDMFMLLFMIYTGLRREEIVPLQYKDIDTEKRVVNVNKAVHFSHNQPVIKKTKNEEVRDVPILNNIYDRLCLLKNEHEDEDFIFPNKDGGIMSETSVKRKIKYACNQLNNDYEKEQKIINSDFKLTENNKISFTYHQLRHTYACILHKAGVDLKEAQYFTGHKDVQVLLDVYTHLDAEDKSNAISKLNAFV